MIKLKEAAYQDCPHCLAHTTLFLQPISHLERMTKYRVGYCNRCKKYCICFVEKSEGGNELQGLQYKKTWVIPSVPPEISPCPEHLPEDVRKYYKEARSTFQLSNKAAIMLLRIGLEMLCKHHNCKGKNLKSKAEDLCDKFDLDHSCIQAASIIRNEGNIIAHIRDCASLENESLILFDLFSIISEKINLKNKIDLMHERVPKDK